MVVFFWLFFFILNIFFVCFHKKSKAVQVISYSFVLFVLLGNERVADYGNYLASYNSKVQNPDNFVEVGYSFLTKIGQLFGLEYNQFRLLSSMFFLIILFRVLNKKMYNPHMFYVFYCSFLLFMDAIQIRFFWASVLALWAFNIYVEKRDKLYIIKSSLLMISSMLIHSGAFLFCGPFFAIVVIDNISFFKKYYKQMIVVALMLAFYILNNIDFHKYSYLIDQSRLRRYLYTKSGRGFIFPWLLQFIQFIRIVIIKKEEKIFEIRDKREIDFLFKLSGIAFLYLPLYVINLNFYRCERTFFMFFLCYGVALTQKYIKKNRFLIYSLCFVECCIWLIYEIVFDQLVQNLFVPLIY